jgi:hypothetical protein
MRDHQTRTLATLRETRRVAEKVYATAVQLGFVELARFEAEAIARLEDAIARLEASAERRRAADPAAQPPPRMPEPSEGPGRGAGPG